MFAIYVPILCLLKLFCFIGYFDMTIFEIIAKHDSNLFLIYVLFNYVTINIKHVDVDTRSF